MTSVSLRASKDSDAAKSGVALTARIGPNAVIQTLRAVAEQRGAKTASALAALAGLPEQPPKAMIAETDFVRLVSAIRAELPIDRSASILTRAGYLTADYVAANRIPAFFKVMLHRLPPRLAVPLLLAAFRRHAWTFAGRSRFSVAGAFPGEIVLDDAPTCRRTGVDSFCGEYYAAAFEGLLRLAAPHVRVTEVACRCNGDRDCRFAIETIPTPVTG